MSDWVTVADYVTATGAPAATYTTDDLTFLQTACDAVSAFITDARPDLTPPPATTNDNGDSIISSQPIPGGAPEAAACWAAVQMVKRWFERRGAANGTGYAEFGYIPSAVRGDGDVVAALKIGANSMPIAL